MRLAGGAVGEDEMKDGDPNQAFAGSGGGYTARQQDHLGPAGRVTNLGRYKV